MLLRLLLQRAPCSSSTRSSLLPNHKGENLANWVPYDEAIELVGQLGLVLLVMEGGLSVEIGRLRRIGLVAVLIAVAGTVLPCLLGWGFMMAVRGTGSLEGIAAGTALSSTSIGMATKMLQNVGILNTHLGSLITVAAMVDDVLSLVILAVLSQLSEDSDGDDSQSAGDRAWQILQPIVVSLAVVAAGAVLVVVVPRAYSHGTTAMDPARRDTAVLAGLLLLTLGATLGAGYAGSTHLLGAFVGGLAFSRVPRALPLWLEYHHLADWLASIFFASVGFTVPVGVLFDPTSVGLGLAYTVPAVLGKFCTGAFTRNWPDTQVVGWAMVGRGELGFVMAKEAFDEDIISEKTLAIVVWALLVATFVAPFLMRHALKRKLAREQALGDEGQPDMHAGRDAARGMPELVPEQRRNGNGPDMWAVDGGIAKHVDRVHRVHLTEV